MTFSSFNPVRFYDTDETPVGLMSYEQTFLESDLIRLEVFLSPGDDPLPVCVLDVVTQECTEHSDWSSYPVNADCTCVIYRVSGLVEGTYTLSIGRYRSNVIHVLPDGTGNTVLIQYAYKDNCGRTDVISDIAGLIMYFELRIPGGFKESEWSFNVSNEQFVTQDSDIVELSAVDYTEKVLTIGSPSGVSVRLAGLVNMALVCPLVFIDGIRYVRSGESQLEHDTDGTREAHVYSVTLREAHYLNAEFERNIRINLRKTPKKIRRTDKNLRRI